MNFKRVLIIFASVAMFTAGTAFADMHQHGHGDHGSGPFVLFSPQVVEQLHLNSTQTQTLNRIQAERKAMFTQMRDQHMAMFQSMQTALKSDNPDLRALTQQTDAAMDQMRDNMRKIQGEELNLYDTLTAQQKKMVREVLLKRMSYMEHHRDWKRGQPKPQKPTDNSSPGI
ncbi:MAG TPA: Spy/CpxP family protein refolding chaperone [Gammaproteobacteria bacterium]|nr:Spy/CpxP family protein refolding chaperone [Gammaproteobacteria bacterium]